MPGGLGIRFRLGQVLTRTNSALGAVWLVRNLAKPHVQSAANSEDEVGTLPLAEYGRSFVWEGMRACRACDSDRFRTSRRRQWRLRREQDLTEAEAYVRHARIPVNGNLFGNISTHRRYSTARDPYFA